MSPNFVCMNKYNCNFIAYSTFMQIIKALIVSSVNTRQYSILYKIVGSVAKWNNTNQRVDERQKCWKCKWKVLPDLDRLAGNRPWTETRVNVTHTEALYVDYSYSIPGVRAGTASAATT